MSFSATKSLSQISKKASMGLLSSTQSAFSSTLSATTSVAFGNVTTAFNNQLNGFLTDLNAKRATAESYLQDKLSIDPFFKSKLTRNKGVSLAWEYEKADVVMGGKGTVEGGWNDAELQQIRETGKVKMYDSYYDEVRTLEGHHINNVADHPKLQSNPDNIRFYRSREDHVNKGHNGDVNNPSSGELIDKNAKLTSTNRQRVIHNELRGVAMSAGIGFGVGFTLSVITELAVKGISSSNLGELLSHATKTGAETAFISTLGYGAGRLATFGLTKMGVDVIRGMGAVMNYAVVGIAAIICSGIILKKTKLFAGDPAPFVMELPAYHMPTISNVLRSMWERGWSFIKKAGTIILLSTIILWFLQGFGWVNGQFGMLEAEQLDSSILAAIGGVIAPIFAPLGWGNWKMAVAAVTGLIAKENVVGTFGVLFGFAEVAEDGVEIWGQLAGSMTAVAAYSFLVFNLLCAPCFAAMGAIKREMNNTKWFLIAIGYQTILAYVVSMCIYQIGTWVTAGSFGIGTIIAIILILGFIYLLFRPYKESKTLNVNLKGMAKAR